MKHRHLLKSGIAMFMAGAMMITSIPVTAMAEETPATKAVAADTLLAAYDFADFAVSADEANVLTDGERNIILESVGSGEKPSLVTDESRGQVLALTENSYANRGFALLPGNPFAEQSVENGLTINFWTKTTGTAGGARCLMDFEVAPASNGRAGTFAVNQQMLYWNTTDQNANFMDFTTGNLGLAEKTWKMVTITMTTDGITFYSNGEKVSHTISAQHTIDYNQMINDLAGTSGIADPSQTHVRLGASLATYWSCAGALMDEVSFYGKELTAAEVAQLYQETIIPVALESVAISGAKSVDEDKSIQLSVAFTPADTTVDRTVTWKSSDESVLTVDANGVATGMGPGTATVTATVAGVDAAPVEITVNDVELVESLEEGYYLTVYSTKTNFYATAANVEQETQSVYFAVSKDGKTFDVLNNNGGVVFAKKGSLCVTEPKIYKDGNTFVIVAPDATASKGYHIFTSEDGVNYYDETLETSTSYASVSLKKSKFPLLLEGENIIATDRNITLGNALKITKEEYTYIVNKLGTVVNTGLESLNTWNVKTTDSITEAALTKAYPSVNATYSDGSIQKFNIDWSGALNGVNLTKAGTYTITGKVNQTKYLNNLKALNGSTLPEDDPANVGPEADNYDEVTETNYYDATKYVEGMADPCIFWDELTGYYYMTGSYFPEEGDQIDGDDNTQQYDRVVLRKSKTLEGLQDRSKQVTIWKVGNQGYDDNGASKASGYRYIWAPEIHRVGNYWVVYFTESHSSSDLFNIYCHALVLDGDKDPYETALSYSDEESEWKDYKMCASPDDASGSINGKSIKPFAASFCLDMTYFQDAVNGEHYVIWAGKPVGNSDLFIAKVDPEQPWKLTSSCIRLTTPEYGWEKIRYQVNEGATVLQKNGKIFMCFSNSGTGSEYSIGMMTADAGTDLLDLNNWTKSPYPLLTSRDVDGEEGPGHNSFTVDQDGNAIFVYHARPTSHNYQHCGWNGEKSSYNGEPLNDPCRHARLKRVHWAADGTPILKMTYEDELVDANKIVKLTVKVTEGEKVTEVVNGISVEKAKVTLGATEKYQIVAKTLPVSDSNMKLTYKSDKPKIAAVDSETGKVTAKKKGKAVITISTANGITKKVTVTVKKKPNKITAKKKTIKVKVGKTAKIGYKLPSGTASNKITFTSSKKKFVKVDAKGKVTGLKKGTAYVTIKTFNNKKAKVKVIVRK